MNEIGDESELGESSDLSDDAQLDDGQPLISRNLKRRGD